MAVLPPDPVFCFKGDMGHIHSICFSVKGNGYVSQLLAATEKGTVYFWDLETNRLQHKQEMGKSIQAIHCFEDKIITQEKCGSLKLWEVSDGRYEVKESHGCNGAFCKTLVLEESLSLIVPQSDGIDVLDARTFKKQKRLVPERPNLGFLMALERVTILDRLYLLGGYETGDVVLWDLEAGEPCAHARFHEHITSLTFDSSNRRGVCGSSADVLQVFTVDKSLGITLKCEVPITNDGCNVVRLRQDGHWHVRHHLNTIGLSSESECRFCGEEEESTEHVVCYCDAIVNCRLHTLGDRGKIFVSGGWNGRVQVFSWKSLRKLAVLAEHKDAITDVQFSPYAVNYWNSKIMAVSGADGTITLWNLYN